MPRVHPHAIGLDNMVQYCLLWPSYVLVSRLSQTLKEAGRYAVHTVFRVA